MRLPLVLCAAFLAAGCGPGGPGEAQTNGGSPPQQTSGPAISGEAGADYGPVEEITGIWETGFEIASFAICADAACGRVAARAETCWLDGTKAFFDQVRASGIQQFRQGSNPHFRVTLKGRIARGGFFGHMGGHRCQIEGQQLVSIKEWPGG